MHIFEKVEEHLRGHDEQVGFVYVIKINGDYKVGKTDNMKNRLTMYKSSYSPHSQPDIEIIFLQEFNNNLITRDAERALLDYDFDGDMIYEGREWIKHGYNDKQIKKYATNAMDNFLENWKKEFREDSYVYRYGSSCYNLRKEVTLNGIKSKRIYN